MGVPKRKMSKSRQRSRKAGQRLRIKTAAARPCPQCGTPQLPHRACRSCGYYRGRQVVTVDAE